MTKRLLSALTSALLLLAFALPSWAQPQTFSLPQAAGNARVLSLGTAVDPQTGKLVEGLAIIHRKDSNSHKPNHPNQGGGQSCYGYLASGAKWKTLEPWTVNPANSSGLGADFVFTNLSDDIVKWEVAAGAEILGTGSSTTQTLVADTTSLDGVNEVYFAAIDDSGTIAVTIVWGIFSGPPFGRELVEWDQVYDDADYDWSASGEAGKMDFENIATHELGHSVGMADLYNLSCVAETMYGYADFGETNKRDLNAGDILGISKLY